MEEDSDRSSAEDSDRSSAGEEEREIEGAQDGWQPAGRRGACCFVHEGCIYMFQGYEGRGWPHPEKAALYRFSLKRGQWEVVQTTGDFNQGSAVSGACCAVLGERMVSFGGWIVGLRVADVHQLDLTTMCWTKCAVTNPSKGPFLKDKAGMVPYGSDMVCVVGGYGYPSEHHMHGGVYRGQQGALYHWDTSGLCWTNEVHLFQLSTGKWISPEMSGQRPPPCAAFTFNMVDSCRAVLFGGRQIERRVNHLYILNLDSWHWEGVLLPSSPNEPWPSERSFHTACSLVDPSCVPSPAHRSHPIPRRFDWLPCSPPDLRPLHPDPSLSPRLLVMWGMDNDADPVADCWLLHLDPVAWTKVHIPAVVPYQPRVWHVVGAWHPTPAEAQLLVFGGCTHNMFREPEPRPFCVGGTAVVEFGVPSLYQLCVQYVASFHFLLSPLLPQHTVKDIELQATAIKNYSHFCIARL